MPKVLSDLIVDHSTIHESLSKEKFAFLKWANEKFDNLNIVSPGYGVGHQINLEFLTTMISDQIIDNKQYLFPEAIIGMDTHISMINSLGIITQNIQENDGNIKLR